MSNLKIDKEIEMCANLLAKFKGSLEDCKKDYEFLKVQEKLYGNTVEHQKAVEAFQERSDGIKVTIKLLNERLNSLQDKKNKAK